MGTRANNSTKARKKRRYYTDKQAALRRVATLVAGGRRQRWCSQLSPPRAGRLLDADVTSVARYELDTATTVGAWSSLGPACPCPETLGRASAERT